jgi:thiamine biosynthesis lipoprotein
MKALLNFRKYVILSAALLGMACGPTGPMQEQVYQGGALGTSYAIKLFSSDTISLQPGIDSVFRVVNQSLSTYIPDSDISRINQGEDSIVVDAMFREVFKASADIYTRTNGYFDPTVGILVDAWGFGPGTALEMDSTRVDSLLRYVGFEKIHLDADGRIVRDVPGVRLDFNAIAKGYAIDRLAVMLEERGIRDYLVEVGGELRARGRNQAKNSPWVVGIDDPQAKEGRAIKKIISFTDRSMASSGNYRKFRIDSLTGEKFVHTINPHTGFTENSNILATSVLAETCMEADGYATAFMAMQLEDSKKLLLETPELEGYIIYLGEEGETREYMTPGFEALVQ